VEKYDGARQATDDVVQSRKYVICMPDN